MKDLSIQSNIEYQPSLVGRLARIIIPLLPNILPSKSYKLSYVPQVITYNKVLRVLYCLEMLASYLYGDRDIRWILDNPSVSATIVGAKNPQQIINNVGALDWRLSDQELMELNEFQRIIIK